MKTKLLAGVFLVAAVVSLHAQTYNALWIPPTLSGTTFNLWLSQTNRAFRATGAKTVTYGFNGADFWGSTLIMNKGDVVQINMTNNLPAITTVHWHGLHIPAIMPLVPDITVAAFRAAALAAEIICGTKQSLLLTK